MMKMEIGFYKDVLPFTAMVAVECTNVGLNVLFKAAANKGMSYYLFITYSNVVATLILLPCLHFFPSKTVLPSKKFPLVSRIFVLGMIGSLLLLLGYKGLGLTSPTLVSAISSLLPALTLIVAVIFRMESLNLRSSSTQSKIIGTLVSISGAVVVIFYKGPTILSVVSPKLSFVLQSPQQSPQSDWIKGGMLILAEYLLITFWYILQTDIMRMYPEKLVVTFFHCLCVAVVSASVCFTVEPDMNVWRLGSDIEFVAILYSACFGAIGSGYVHSWGVQTKGPLYVTMFKPLSIAIAAIMSGMFLGDTLRLGSVVGAIIITTGFYAVLWGMAKEEKDDMGDISSRGTMSTNKTPLLFSHKDEEM